jgi:hypothetical protein
MSNAARNLTEAELAERKAFLARLKTDFPERDAHVVPLRRDLGLPPVADDDPAASAASERNAADEPEDIERGPFYDLLAFDEDHLAAPARVFSLYVGINGVCSVGLDGFRRNKKRIDDIEAKADALRTEIAELKLALTEARCEVREMRPIQENARTLSRGEQGIAGPRGIPGPQGARGERGERGAAGLAAAGFVLDVEGYAATLVSSDGSPSARLAMRPLFERFAEEIAASDDSEG